MGENYKEKAKSPSVLRELALGRMLDNLGSTSDSEQRYNNGYAHNQLAVFTSWIRAFEKRMAQFVSVLNMEIIDAVPVEEKNAEPRKNDFSKIKELVGKGIVVERSIFDNTMTLTNWIENFYQESPSINARAREDQKEIGINAFGTAAHTGFQPWGSEEQPLDSD
jgi:hypothetical protein